MAIRSTKFPGEDAVQMAFDCLLMFFFKVVLVMNCFTKTLINFIYYLTNEALFF